MRPSVSRGVSPVNVGLCSPIEARQGIDSGSSGRLQLWHGYRLGLSIEIAVLGCEIQRCLQRSLASPYQSRSVRIRPYRPQCGY